MQERLTMKRKPNGIVFYRSNSGRTVGIMTGLSRPSRNQKTGAMLQTFILDTTTEPRHPERTCGDCALRHGACYVRWDQGVLSIWRAYHRGSYPIVTPEHAGELAAGKLVRAGTAGDPAFIPPAIWQALVAKSAGHTGYTHQWRWATGLRGVCMASVDSMSEQIDATKRGWSTFRVRKPSGALFSDETLCKAEASGEHCVTCRQCDGRSKKLVITAHGARKNLHPELA